MFSPTHFYGRCSGPHHLFLGPSSQLSTFFLLGLTPRQPILCRKQGHLYVHIYLLPASPLECKLHEGGNLLWPLSSHTNKSSLGSSNNFSGSEKIETRFVKLEDVGKHCLFVCFFNIKMSMICINFIIKLGFMHGGVRPARLIEGQSGRAGPALWSNSGCTPG